MYLIYINSIGKNHKGQYLYEFIFSDTTKNIDGEDWDMEPSSGRAQPPNEVYIKTVGVLTSGLKLDLVQDSTIHSLWAAMDGVIALGWENIMDYETYPEDRLVFPFGMEKQVIEDKLYSRDLILKY